MADLVLLQHNRLRLIERGLAGTAALGIDRKRLLKLMREPEIDRRACP